MLFSRNHTDGAWAARAPRRLRNVVVAMEWVPRADALALRKASVIDSGALTEGQEAALRQAFKLLDIDDSGRLDANEVREPTLPLPLSLPLPLPLPLPVPLPLLLPLTLTLN